MQSWKRKGRYNMANFNFNLVVLGGRLTRDPRMAVTPSGISVCTIDIAVNRAKADKADFFTVNYYRETAEFVSRYFRRGSSICVTGRLELKTWETENGRGQKVEVTGTRADFVDALREMQGGQAVVTPESEIMQGVTGDGGRPAPGFYSTPEARDRIREAGEELPPFPEL